MSTTEESSTEKLAGRYLTFALSRERYGLEILKVQEIIGVSVITKVPKCPDYIKGIINLRGKIIPLIDLRVKFGLSPVPYDEKTCVIVVNVKKDDQTLLVGAIVDTVLEVINFSADEIEASPNYGSQVDANFIVGMGRKPSADLNILIDIEQALSIAELTQMSKGTH